MRSRKVLNDLELSEFRDREIKTLRKTQGGRLFMLRKEVGLSQTELADKCRWYNPIDGSPAQARISHYETDKRQLNSPKDQATLAKVLNTTPMYILAGESESELTGQNKIRLLPLFNWPNLKMVFEKRGKRKKLPTPDGEIAVSHGLQPGPDAFATTVTSEAMLPEFRPGDTIIVDPDRTPTTGDFVVVSIKKSASPVLRQLILDGGLVYYGTTDKQIPATLAKKTNILHGVVIGKTRAY